MITYKKHTAPNGLAGFRVFSGDNCLGTIFYFPDGPMTWKGVAPDGTRFSDASKAKITQRLRVHAAATRSVPGPQTSSKEADLPVLTEASLPTTSRLSQLEARTSCAASADYASAPTQPLIGSSSVATNADENHCVGWDVNENSCRSEQENNEDPLPGSALPHLDFSSDSFSEYHLADFEHNPSLHMSDVGTTMSSSSRSKGLRILPLLNAEKGQVLARSQVDRSFEGVNDAVETVARQVVTDDRPQNNRKPALNKGYGLCPYREASFAMVVLVVELLGIPIRQVRSRFNHRHCAEFFRTASSIGVPLPIGGSQANMALTQSPKTREVGRPMTRRDTIRDKIMPRVRVDDRR